MSLSPQRFAVLRMIAVDIDAYMYVYSSTKSFLFNLLTRMGMNEKTKQLNDQL